MDLLPVCLVAGFYCIYLEEIVVGGGGGILKYYSRGVLFTIIK